MLGVINMWELDVLRSRDTLKLTCETKQKVNGGFDAMTQASLIM